MPDGIVEKEGHKFTVSGKILVKETNRGIPNLHVVLYDFDGNQTQLKKLANLVNDLRGDNTYNTTPNNNATHYPTASISRYHSFWNNLPAERLGSVLTGSNGEFTLAFDESLFKAKDKKRRPDLILFVLAPEEAQSNEQVGVLSNPAVHRILLFSYDVRTDSGRTESYIIRIPNKTLEENGIHVLEKEDGQDLGVKIAESMAKSKETSDKIHAKRFEMIKIDVEKEKPIIEATNEAFKNFHLSSLPASMRGEWTYFDSAKKAIPPSIFADEELLKNISKIIRENIKRLSDGHGIRLAFTNQERETFEKKRTHDGYNVSDIQQRVSLMLTGPEALSGKSLRETSKEMFAIKGMIEGLQDFLRESDEGPEASDESDSGDGEPPHIRAEDYVNKQMDGLMRDKKGDKSALARMLDSKRASQGQVMDSIGDLSLSGGPADQVAYHDYSDLQIAFDNVWTELFDKDIEKLSRAEYGNILRRRNKFGDGIPFDRTGLLLSRSDLARLVTESISAEVLTKSADKPPESVIAVVAVSKEEWNSLTQEEKGRVIALADAYSSISEKLDSFPVDDSSGLSGPTPFGINQAVFANFFGLNAWTNQGFYSPIRAALKAAIRASKKQIEEIVSQAYERKKRQQLESRREREINRPRDELERRLKEPHKFDIFLPNSINFGLLVTYRQRWEPLNYQVGELVETVPLAPKQTRKITTKKVTKTKTSRKEIENSLSRMKRGSDEKIRADSEIAEKAATKTNFQTSASGGGNLGVWNVSAKTQFGMDMQRSSESKKSQLRENTLKAAKEFKEENKITVSTEQTMELTEEFADEITNPNDEISVTYLFYELQRRYRISEKIHKVTPVIMVANDVPSPDQIDEDWLITHDWILKRSILDDSFKEDLVTLKDNTGGNLLNIYFLEDKIKAHEKMINTLQAELEEKERELSVAETNLTEFEEEKPGKEGKIQTKRETVERKQRAVGQLETAMANELNALREAREGLLKAKQEQIKHDISLLRLQIHVKQNILYYMQKIWEMEPPDQRFYRLYNIEVPSFEPSKPKEGVDMKPFTPDSGIEYMVNKLASKDSIGTTTLPPPKLAELTEEEKREKLVDIADLNNPLGFSGNYIVFPLKELNYLSLYMMLDYLDEPLGGLIDPDKFSNYTSEDIVAFLDHAVKSDKNFFTIKELDDAIEWLTKRKKLNRKESEEITVPSDSLFIEILPGSKPILEDFKLAHRAIDAQKASLEKIRYGARLLKGNYEDPEVDKRIILNGKATAPVVDVDE